ncbi:hypothetical protein D3C85_1283010 [compost metagenome]
MKQVIASVLILVGYVAVALAFFSGIGYALFLMGPGGVAVGVAAWSGFVLWAKLLVGGFVSMLVGGIMGVS